MTFTSEGSILEWRGEGETLRIEPWGTDSVRIRSSKKMPISEQNWGLLGEHHEPGQAVRVEISEDQSLATLTNGNITVTAHAFKEGNAGAGHTESLCELSFSKADGTEPLPGNAAARRPETARTQVQPNGRRQSTDRSDIPIPPKMSIFTVWANTSNPTWISKDAPSNLRTAIPKHQSPSWYRQPATDSSGTTPPSAPPNSAKPHAVGR
mgnify:CR=1 FL=1